MTRRVLVRRGGLVESVHRIHAVVADAAGVRVAHAGDPRIPTFYRSAAKPIQALPLVEDGAVEALGITDEELALCCASHNSEAHHVEIARRILARAGLAEDALECGGHMPLREEEGVRLLLAGVRPGPIHSNCSGKHAGMLALAVHHDWPTRGYVKALHPVQRRVLHEVSRWTEMDENQIGTGVDGCGVVCFRVPLEAVATSFARFAEAAHRGEPGPSRIVAAMTGHPWMVAGTGRLCTALMEATGGRVFAKVGAEGVYALGVPSQGLGVAVKVEDGARRAADVALLHTMIALELLDEPARAALDPWLNPTLRNTRGEVVGAVEADFEMTRTPTEGSTP